MKLERNRDDGKSLTGQLILPIGKGLASIERSWADPIQPIPPGEYKLVPHFGVKYRNVFALVNPDLGVTHFVPNTNHPKPRTAILIHPANFARELRGCIALGLVRDTIRDPKSDYTNVSMVVRSREAVKIFNDYVRSLPEKERYLVIAENASVRNFRSRIQRQG